MTSFVPFVILGISVSHTPTVLNAPKCEAVDKRILITLGGGGLACLQNIRTLLACLWQHLDEMRVDQPLSDPMKAAYTAVANVKWDGYKAKTNIWVRMNTVADPVRIAEIFNQSVEQGGNWNIFMTEVELQTVASTVLNNFVEADA